MRQVVFLTLLFIAFIHSAFGQNTYVYKVENLTGEGNIYFLDSDNNLSLEATLASGEEIFADIAVTPEGELYGLTTGGTIKKINLEDATTEVVTYFSIFSGHTAFVCDASSNFYALDFFNDLYRLNLETLEEEFVFNLGEFSPGDLGFYRGKLVFPSSIQSVIKSFDLETFEIKTIYCLPEEITAQFDIYGISNDFNECGEEKLIVSSQTNYMFRVDVENNSYENLNIDFGEQSNSQINGLGSIYDQLSSLCNEIVTEIDCDYVEGITGIENSEISFYPNPASEKITFINHETIESITILNGVGELVRVETDLSAGIDLSSLTRGVYMMKIDLKDSSSRAEKLVHS